jgi:phenylpropionate dioxygenase-like ring-hydroxylating dioxygenase large terminal subunit
MTSTLSAPNLKTYNAYNSRRGLTEDADLTHVERGTPMGEYMRRFWQPIAYEPEVTDLPKKIKVLCEDLVLFRTAKGELGLVEQRCSHRGASLEYGVISDEGIRCAYHGFHYAPDGTILATGSGAPMANAGKLCHGAYPLHVFNSLIFAYMGPPERKPPFPMLDLYENEHITIEPGIERQCNNDCNWLQIHENAMDPVHTAYLHTLLTGTQRGFSDEMGVLPILQWAPGADGMHYMASRRLGDMVWVRILDAFMPNFGLVPPSDGGAMGKEKANTSQLSYVAAWVVPIDNENSHRIYLRFNDHRNPLRPVQRAMNFGQAKDRPYEERQRYPGDYDMFMSQGPIAIHGYENLTPTDYGVIALREMFREGMRAVKEGKDPVGINRDPNYRIRTRTQNTFIRAPKAATPEEDVALLKQVGRQVAEANYLNEFPPL